MQRDEQLMCFENKYLYYIFLCWALYEWKVMVVVAALTDVGGIWWGSQKVAVHNVCNMRQQGVFLVCGDTLVYHINNIKYL